MEKARQPRLRTIDRMRAIGRYVFGTVEPMKERHQWKPSPQRDVGKSAAKAAEVQLVLEGMEDYHRVFHYERDE